MQLAFNWIRAFYDNIYPPCIVILPNSMLCSSFQFWILRPVPQRSIQPTLDFRKSCWVPFSIFWGNTLCFYISFMMQTSAVPFFNGRHTKGVPFLSRKSLKRVRCWTSSGVSLQKLCCTPPWNTLPHKYGTPSQLWKYLATVLRSVSQKKKRKSVDLPHPLPPATPLLYSDNSPKLSTW